MEQEETNKYIIAHGLLWIFFVVTLPMREVYPSDMNLTGDGWIVKLLLVENIKAFMKWMDEKFD